MCIKRDTARLTGCCLSVASFALLCPCPIMGHNALMYVFCLSVRPVPNPKLRMEERRKLKIGRKEARDTDHPWSYLELERSNIYRGGGKFWCHTACVLHMDVNVQRMISVIVIWLTSKLKALSSCNISMLGQPWRWTYKIYWNIQYTGQP